MSNEVITTGHAEHPLLRAAIDKGLDVESIGKLVALVREEQDRAAARAFAEDLARFASMLAPVTKNRTAKFATKAGSPVSYRYADLGQIAKHVSAPLASCRLSYAWSTTFTDGMVNVTCRLTHAEGAFRESLFSAPVGSNPLLSAPQNAKVAVTFAQRVSLIQVLGLTDTEDDVDGADMGREESGECITENQAADLEVWVENLKGDKAKFLKWLKADSFESIRAADYGRAVDFLKSKERA